ncbi:hypothetical protein P3C29_21835 [Pseudomonas sp. 1912-s]|uniref:DUF6602 domain-containing protein n=1 Tax=Pseudomonas sp. 1912-s TaxID=3033802 RepID=UPI0023E038D6|nr:DUF6602 domain-containing protein [Pseudomonas sp. 1912-s]MDF3201337.1 hypothetical protein [Pseudomonas sp. 1912-s]
MVDKLISKHFSQVRGELLQLSEKFSLAEHRDIKGYGREALARNFLKSHLPKVVDFFTGEIIDCDDNRSSQMDLIIYAGHCPRLPLIDDFHLAFIDAVMAAIEVKSVLNASDMSQCMLASQRLKTLRRDEIILGLNDTKVRFEKLRSDYELVDKLDKAGVKLEFKYEERKTNLKKTPYIVFAYKGATKESLCHLIGRYKEEAGPEYSLEEHGPDMIINLERGFYIYKDNDFLWPKQKGENASAYCIWEADSDAHKGEVLGGLYMLLANLSTAFLLHPPIIELTDYFKPNGKPL